jgi:uncharacterized protein (DUF2345 family)
MANVETRSSARVNKTYGNGGPFLAKVVGHLDPTYMGSLEVTLLRQFGNDYANDSQTFVARCATPFYGVTSYSHMGDNKGNADAFNDTQKSYGMWFVPPDVGVTVIVVLIDGDPSQCFWIACVPDKFANQMVPALASSSNIDNTPEDKKYFPNKGLPVGEVNRRANIAVGANIDSAKRPVHPFAEKLLEQGLLMDDVRGTTTSSPRRNLPSSVFGISTPGPLDQLGKKATIGTKESKTTTQIPVSRLGGTTLVMDDGDERFQRKKSPREGPPEYADRTNNEKGLDNIPISEYFRVRTRTGHQILLHNSEDLIYIGNAAGTTWIEMSSNGKLDIFANDSVSIHTKQDFNLRADRDFNIEAGRNINMKSVAGRIQTEAATDLINIIKRDHFTQVSGNVHQTIAKNRLVKVSGEDSLISQKVKINSSGTLSIKSNADLRLQAATNTNIVSGAKHVEQAARIEMNCAAGDIAEIADTAKTPTVLSTYELAVVDEKLVWKDTQYKSENKLSSIMKRIPMHEPWLDHENLNPTNFTPEKTDRG